MADTHAVTNHVVGLDTVAGLMKNVLSEDIVAAVSNFPSVKEDSAYQWKECSKYLFISSVFVF